MAKESPSSPSAFSKFVEFYSYDSGEKEDVPGVVALIGNQAKMIGLPEGLENQLIGGILGRSPTVLFPSDGEKFMEALAFEFKGTYLRASTIITIGEM